ncbi:hypothetical protein IMPR6_90157 [Imperialibacter sp. EC-SDR9]|nr:hypothetical protein IMPERIA89_740072 [Imperialibacter sp. 89]VVT35688.1 hypothetical protein IMPR6_90157 [Imperialibacter sp. EC-SDR9]
MNKLGDLGGCAMSIRKLEHPSNIMNDANNIRRSRQFLYSISTTNSCE